MVFNQLRKSNLTRGFAGATTLLLAAGAINPDYVSAQEDASQHEITLEQELHADGVMPPPGYDAQSTDKTDFDVSEGDNSEVTEVTHQVSDPEKEGSLLVDMPWDSVVKVEDTQPDKAEESVELPYHLDPDRDVRVEPTTGEWNASENGNTFLPAEDSTTDKCNEAANRLLNSDIGGVCLKDVVAHSRGYPIEVGAFPNEEPEEGVVIDFVKDACNGQEDYVCFKRVAPTGDDTINISGTFNADEISGLTGRMDSLEDALEQSNGRDHVYVKNVFFNHSSNDPSTSGTGHNDSDTLVVKEGAEEKEGYTAVTTDSAVELLLDYGLKTRTSVQKLGGELTKTNAAILKVLQQEEGLRKDADEILSGRINSLDRNMDTLYNIVIKSGGLYCMDDGSAVEAIGIPTLEDTTNACEDGQVLISPKDALDVLIYRSLTLSDALGQTEEKLGERINNLKGYVNSKLGDLTLQLENQTTRCVSEHIAERYNVDPIEGATACLEEDGNGKPYVRISLGDLTIENADENFIQQIEIDRNTEALRDLISVGVKAGARLRLGSNPKASDITGVAKFEFDIRLPFTPVFAGLYVEAPFAFENGGQYTHTDNPEAEIVDGYLINDMQSRKTMFGFGGRAGVAINMEPGEGPDGETINHFPKRLSLYGEVGAVHQTGTDFRSFTEVGPGGHILNLEDVTEVTRKLDPRLTLTGGAGVEVELYRGKGGSFILFFDYRHVSGGGHEIGGGIGFKY
jgi:hypothetical protein